ncbi:carbohydrate-binding protein [Aquimarina agarivorans]|uniref:carbohydrate-binding protein n=1 Tax=Aquimarina agarivorans TaxID=980584 RepID=UPI001110EC50|nr:carbohydrate-binding protein [Aquimarina agarivorans]
MNLLKQSLKHTMMIIVFLLAKPILIYSQGCATKVTQKDYDNALLINAAIDSQKLQQRTLHNGNPLPRAKIIIPFISQIITRADGTGGISLKKINEGIRYTNDFFANIGVELKEYQSPKYINSDQFYDFIMNDETAITNAYEVDQVLNLFFANSILNANGGSYCGYAYFPNPSDLENDLNRIFMDNDCMGGFPETTFTHEIGHYLDLFHTHETFRGSEYVNGTNCSTTGDLICDTPADPQLSFAKVNTNCNYTFFETDSNGDVYNPDTSNIMSYSRHSCRTKLSPQQLEKARFTTENYRNDLKKIPTNSQSPYNGVTQSIPGIIEMEFYDLGGQEIAYNDTDTGNNGNQLRNDDVDITGGSVAWIQAGEWLEYTVNIEESGNFTVNANIASVFDSSSFTLSIDDTVIGNDFIVPNTINWENYQNVSQPNIPLEAGIKTLRFTSNTGGFNIDKLSFSKSSLPPKTKVQLPYNGVAQTIPGSIEAEFYDLGGQGVAYYDTSNGNNGNYLRIDDVDVEKGSVNGNVGWINANEWMEYTVEVKETGNYTIFANVASLTNNNTFTLYMNDNKLGENFKVPNTGNWQSYQETAISNISLTAGRQVLRFETASGRFNFDKLDFSLNSSIPEQLPYNGIAQTIPGTIEMEFYDVGGQGVAYNDKDTGNNGNYLRTDDVDMYAGIVAWIQKDEWIEYTINIEQTGNYNINAVISSIFSERNFELTIDGVVVGQQYDVPNTGDWENFETISQENILLTAGQKILRFTSLTGGFNIDKINITAATAFQLPANNSNSITEENNVSIYPNPSIADVVFSAPEIITKVILHNSFGKFVGMFKGTKQRELKLNLNGLKKGSYITLMHTHKNTYKATLIKE